MCPSIWPVIGEISGSFGQRMDPFSGEGAWHTGVDIASHYGDEVHASADGVIVFQDHGVFSPGVDSGRIRPAKVKLAGSI